MTTLWLKLALKNKNKKDNKSKLCKKFDWAKLSNFKIVLIIIIIINLLL